MDKHIKKLIIIFLCFLTAIFCSFAVAACNTKGEEGDSNDNPSTPVDPTENDTPHTHSYGEWIIIKNATCTEKGSQSRYCTCGDEQTISIDALGHSVQHHSAQSATCTEKGWEAYDTCSRCDYTTYKETAVLGHSIQSHKAQAVTCTEKGWETYDTCSRCEYTTYKEIAALGHSIQSHKAQSATCTEKGWETYDTCSHCNYTTFKEIAALGHAIQSHKAQTATCTEKGWEAYDTCSRCDYTTYKEIAALGHAIQSHKAQTATCTEKGWEAYDTCSRCDYITYKEIAALGHAIQSHKAQSATCTEKGWEAYDTCSRCDYTTYKEIAALGHSIQNHKAQSATCTEKGWEAYDTCSRCDYTTYKEIAALGHDFTGNFQNNSSVHWHTCLNGCGKTDNSIKHTFNNDSCTICGYSVTYTQNLAYTLSADGTYYILSGIGDAVESYISALPEVNGKPVKEVAANAFAGNEEITELYLPESVSIINDGAFANCKNLSEIVLFNNYTSIGESAFAGTAYFNDRTNWVDNMLYLGANLISVRTTTLGTTNIKEGTTLIADGAYSDCANIIGVEFPESLRYIGVNVFNGCTSIENITVPDTVEQAEAFSGLTGLKQITLPAHLAHVAPKTVQELTVTCGEIAAEAFKDFTSLTKVIVNDGVTSIGAGAFIGCNSIIEMTLPFVGSRAEVEEKNGYEAVFGYIFGYTTSKDYWIEGGAVRQYALQKVYVSGSSTSTSTTYYFYYIPASIKKVTVTGSKLPNCAFYNCRNLTDISLPNGIAQIGSSVFYNCSALENLNCTGGLPAIPHSLFYGCGSLTGITIPDGIASIGANAFYGCSGLIDIAIPDSVTSIGESAFYGCSGMSNVTIGNGVTNIGESVFSGCSGLTDIYYTGDIASWCKIIGLDDLMTNSKNLFINNQEITGELVIPDSVAEISSFAFACLGGLIKVSIPNSVTSISNDTFYGCCNLSSVNIPDGVTSIDDSTFYGCSSLSSIAIPDGVTSIGSNAFYGCGSLTNIEIPKSVVSIADNAFGNCSGIEAVTVSEGNKWYSSQTGILYNKNKTKFLLIPQALKGDIIIPDGITKIASSAFSGRKEITSIEFPDKLTEIGYNAFSGCSGLTSLTIPDSVTSIGSSAFGKCSGIESITACFSTFKNGNYSYMLGAIFGEEEYEGSYRVNQSVIGAFRAENYYIPNKLKYLNIAGDIYNECFSGYKSLKQVTVTGSSIDFRGFMSCSELTSIVIGNEMTAIGNEAFTYCYNLKCVYYKGTAEEWGNISIGSEDYTSLTSAPRYYYSETEPQLNAEGTAYNGNYWHYDADGMTPVIWKKEI